MADPHCSPYLEYCRATASAFHVEVTRWVAHRTGNVLAGVPRVLKDRQATQMLSSDRHFPELKKVNNKVTSSRFANHKTHLTDPAPDVTVCGVSTRRHKFVGLFRVGFPCRASVGVGPKSNRFGC
jgi:hypothetical protein